MAEHEGRWLIASASDKSINDTAAHLHHTRQNKTARTPSITVSIVSRLFFCLRSGILQNEYMNTLFSAGSNARGQLAICNTEDVHIFHLCSLGSPPVPFLDDKRLPLQLVSGSNHSLLLLETHDKPRRELWGCGDGRKGQLGPQLAAVPFTTMFTPIVFSDPSGRIGDLGGFSIKMIAAAWETSYVVLSYPGKDDVLMSFGANDYGDLGTIVATTEVDELGTPHLVDLVEISEVKQLNPHKITIDSVETSTHHVVVNFTLVLQDEVSQSLVAGWGTSRHGQLGHSHSGRALPSFLSSPRLVQSELSEPVISAALGVQHTVMLHSNGRLSSLGSDRKGQLRGLEDLYGAVAISCTWNGTYVVLEHDNQWVVRCSGSNSKGQLGFPPTEPQTVHFPLTVQFPFSSKTHEFVRLACGSEHVVCLFSVDERSEVWGWGWNEHGNLGTGGTEDVHVPVKIWPTASQPNSVVTNVWAGCGVTWILTSSSV